MREIDEDRVTDAEEKIQAACTPATQPRGRAQRWLRGRILVLYMEWVPFACIRDFARFPGY